MLILLHLQPGITIGNIFVQTIYSLFMISRQYVFCLYLLLLAAALNGHAQGVPPAERVCGKWESTDKRLIIQVYMEHSQYLAKLLWYSNTGGKPLDYWRDVKNPDPKLRSRRLLGMSLLRGLRYDKDSNSWEDGSVYDSTHGRYWNASATIDKKGQLHVRGYWHFKFIGRTMSFYRVG